MFEIVDNDGRGRTDAGPCVYYKLTFEPSAQVSKKVLSISHGRGGGRLLVNCVPMREQRTSKSTINSVF